MRKFFKGISNIFKSTKYSIKFSLRNAKKETLVTLTVSLASAFLSWVVVDTTGSFINSVQYVINNNYQTSWLYYLMPSIWYLGGAMVIFGVLETISWVSNGGMNNKLKFANEREINLFKSKLDPIALKSKEYTQVYSKIINSDDGFDVRRWYAMQAKDFITNLVKTIVFSVGLMSYSPYYAMILLIPIILLAWNEYYFNKTYFKFCDEISLLDRKRGVLEKVFSRNVSLIQAKNFNQTEMLIERIAKKVKVHIDGRQEQRNDSAFREIIIKIIFAIIYTGVVVSVFKDIIFGVFAIGIGVVIVVAMQQFRDAVEWTIRNLNYLIAQSRYILIIEEEFFGIKPALITNNPVVPKFENTPIIILSDVHFTYPNSNKEVLTGVNLTIEPNNKIMIVGESGCGKSTLMQILIRHYDPTAGNVVINGVNLKNIDTSDWYNYISVQMQEYEIFERKVSHEIASSVFDKPVDIERVKWAGEVACCDTFIMETPNGYNTQIGINFGGQEFSGGENQRIAVARTLYRNTPILILDEPDAKLDPINADKLFSNVLKIKDKTVIVVSHKVSRAHLFDNIVVIKDGRIDDFGSHKTLYKKKGHYFDLLMAEKSEKVD